MDTPIPSNIVLHQQSKALEIEFDNGQRFMLPCEFLRVYSPSAEVMGHGPGQETLQVGKEDVNIVGIRPVGNYGIAPTFSDGHDTGIYTWEWLYNLGTQHHRLWHEYLDKLHAAGHTRNANRPT